MADENNNQQQPASDSSLVDVAKQVGALAGKVAAATGIAGGKKQKVRPATEASKPGKLQKQHKERLPRREKKARQKAAAKQA